MNEITIGLATCGISAGAMKTFEKLQKEIKKNRLNTKLKKVGCIGMCYNEPIVEVKKGKIDVFYKKLTEDKVPRLIKSIKKGEIIKEWLIAEKSNLKEAEFFKSQVKLITKNCGLINPIDIKEYISTGGYSGLKNSLNLKPNDVIEVVKKSGLRGRGGAGFPTGIKWGFVAKNPYPHYLICNFDEGDPGAFMNRALVESDPFRLIEGMTIAGYAIQAKEGYIYVRAEYPLAIKTLEEAILIAKKNKLLGKNILGKNFNFEIKIKKGAGAFVCGEETALMKSVMGERGMPMPRPPFPAEKGLWGNPSNINNVGTLSHVATIFQIGVDNYTKYGTENTKGTKVFCLTGKIKRSGMIEVPFGITLKKIIYEIGGGIKKNRKFKAAQTGGPSGGCLPLSVINEKIDYENLKKLGSIMGSGGLVVMDEDNCMVDIAKFFLTFTQDESCGKCTPCREGTKRMLEILERIAKGEGKKEDIDLLELLGKNITLTSLCGLGRTASNPVLSTLKYFKEEYLKHIEHKRCDASVCEALFTSPCANTCPCNIDVPNYIGLIKDGRFKEAYSLIMQQNPFPGVCGRVCHHPCEDRCRRAERDETVSIRHLKRYAADYGTNGSYVIVKNKPKDQVAIVGAGPAGLTCAYHLSRLGYIVTVFEKLPIVGGMLAIGIPDYRLPKKILNKEVGMIKRLGVKIKTNTDIGKKIKLSDLRKEFKAIFLALGCYKSRNLNIKGENLKGAIHGTEFLKNVGLGKKFNLKCKNVIVIGGGNVALDSARTAKRLGASVTILYRREKEDMKAEKEEIEEAENEKIKFIFLAIPKEIIGKSKVERLVCQKMKLGDYDDSGRRTPIESEETFSLNCDNIIIAIGETPDTTFAAGSRLEMTKWGTLVVDIHNQTSKEGVFAGGDIVTGPSTVIDAIAAGKRAAISIDKYLGGKGELVDLSYKIAKPEFKLEEEFKGKRRNVPLLKANRRIGFKEVELNYSKTDAILEARRCLRCDQKEI